MEKAEDRAMGVHKLEDVLGVCGMCQFDSLCKIRSMVIIESKDGRVLEV